MGCWEGLWSWNDGGTAGSEQIQLEILDSHGESDSARGEDRAGKSRLNSNSKFESLLRGSGFLSVLNKYSPLYIQMIVVIHAISFILRKQSLPTWQEESRNITRLLVSELV